MPGNPNDPQSVRISVSLYSGLVKAYPREFRSEFGTAMVQVFRDSCHRAGQEGNSLAFLSLWVRILIDTFKSIIEEHVTGETHMTREKFYRLSGWALILSPILFAVGFWAASRQEYPYLPIDRFADSAGIVLAVAGLLFGSLGLMGLIGRFSPRWKPASILLGLAAFAGLVSAIGAGLLSIVENGVWYMFMGGLLVQYLLLGAFGILNLQQRHFPRWNGLPLLAFWLPIAALLSSRLIQVAVPTSLLAAGWLLSCIMFVGMGYMLQSTSQEATLITA
jgi:hypothetical protein